MTLGSYELLLHNNFKYSRLQLKLCTTFLLTAQLLSLSGCSNAHDNQVWSHTHHVLPIEAIKTPTCGHNKPRTTNFSIEKNLCYSILS